MLHDRFRDWNLEPKYQKLSRQRARKRVGKVTAVPKSQLSARDASISNGSSISNREDGIAAAAAGGSARSDAREINRAGHSGNNPYISEVLCADPEAPKI